MVTTVTDNSPQAINTSLFSLEKDTDGKVLLLNNKIKEANDAIAAINKILDGINKDAGVVSVNGKQGIVTLDASDIEGFAEVATSGSYNDLSNKPTIPAAQVNSDWNATSGVARILNKPSLATVATSGSYNDLSNKPTIPSKTSQLTNDSDFATNAGVLSDIASALSGGQTYGINITGNASTAQKLSIALSFNSGGSTVYKKISGLVVPNQENVFLLQSRAGELLLMSVGHGDGAQLAKPKVKRLFDVYSKIQGFSILNSDVIVKIAAWSHACYLTQIAGSTISEITISDSTQSEYDSGTPITIET